MSQSDTALSRWWPERITSLVAFAGLLCAVLVGFSVRSRQNAASDFKTLYASSWCFARGIDAYSFPNLASVFDTNLVIQPRDWYAHAPVYPPFTLLVLTPLTILPMAQAAYAWIVLSAATLAFATAQLARAAGEIFHLAASWRILLIAFAAASPLASFGLEFGNLSIIVAALCIFALFTSVKAKPWPSATALAIALLLKPHLAIWPVASMALSQSPPARQIALKAILLCAIVVSAMALCALSLKSNFMQLAGYRAIVNSELSTGSMAAANHELIEVPAQITSLQSLVAYLPPEDAHLTVLSIATLSVMGAALLWSALQLPSRSSSMHFESAAAWVAFGMVATYHRAHDAILLLLLLLPPSFARLHASRRDPLPWCALILLAALSLGPSTPSLQHLVADPHLGALERFLLYRQASLAAFLLAAVLAANQLRAALQASNHGGSSASSHPLAALWR